MAFKKKAKAGQGTASGFDATPPRDGVQMSNNGKKTNLYQHKAVDQGTKGIKKLWATYKGFLISSFREANRGQQEMWINRLAIICCVGISVIVLNCFYSVLLPAIRIISLPIIAGLAYFIANKLVAPAIIKRLGGNMSDR